MAHVRGERIEAFSPRALLNLRAFLFDGEPDPVRNRPSSLFSRAIVLPNQRLISDTHFDAMATPQTAEDIAGGGASSTAPEAVARTISLRGRSLRGAVLVASDLRKADLTGADLRGARLNRAWLEGASLDRAQLQGAWLFNAELQGASLQMAQLQGASLASAQLQGASLQMAQLQGASLERVQLQGASLDFAQLRGAYLTAAQLQGASLQRAQLQGASLEGAQLQGVWLRGMGVWRVTGAASIDLVDLRHVSFAPDLPRRTNGEAVAWSTAIDEWAADLPDERRRTRFRERLAVVTSPDDPPAHAALRAVWQSLPSPESASVGEILGDLACDDNGAPFVARGILRQFAGPGTFLVWPPEFMVRDLREHRATFAQRLLDAETCPGARGLSDAERARLRAIAEGRD